MIAGAVSAQQTADIHPVIGAKPPKELKASDIMALPDAERQAWIHGAVSMTAQMMSGDDAGKAGCISGWYFSGNGSEVLDIAMEKYSEHPATSIVYAAAKNVCKDY